MPYCSNCGRKLADFDNFCEDCGKKRTGKIIEKIDPKVARINEIYTKLAIKETDTKVTAKEEENKPHIKGPINSNMSKVRFEIVMISVFSDIWDSIIIFMLCAIVLSLANFSVTLAILPAFTYFMLKLAARIDDQDIIKKIIKKYPDLDEKLQTAYDNEKKSNDFISFKGIFIRAVVIIFLVFSFLTINLIYVQQVGTRILTDNPTKIYIVLECLFICFLLYYGLLMITAKRKILNPEDDKQGILKLTESENRYTISQNKKPEPELPGISFRELLNEKALCRDSSRELKSEETEEEVLDTTPLFCSQCDRPISDTDVYCRYCGNKLGVDSTYEKENQDRNYDGVVLRRNANFFYKFAKFFSDNDSDHTEKHDYSLNNQKGKEKRNGLFTQVLTLDKRSRITIGVVFLLILLIGGIILTGSGFFNKQAPTEKNKGKQAPHGENISGSLFSTDTDPCSVKCKAEGVECERSCYSKSSMDACERKCGSLYQICLDECDYQLKK
jgi:hypothetical protein